MYGSTLRNSGIPWIRSYTDAVNHYNDVTPIRGTGSNAGTRPLGSRNKPHFQIVKTSDTSIACRLYKTDVITFHEDGRIKFRTDRYNTSTTANFISQVLGRPCGKYDNRLVLHVDGGEYTVNDHLELQEAGGTYKVGFCLQDIVHTIDRKEMNKVRNKYQDYIAYVSGMVKINEGRMVMADLRSHGSEIVAAIGIPPDLIGLPPKIDVSVYTNASATAQYIDKFFYLVDSKDAGNWHLSFLWLVHSARMHWGAGVLQFTEKFLYDTFNDMLIAKNPHVLVPKLVEKGKVKADKYKRFKYFKEL